MTGQSSAGVVDAIRRHAIDGTVGTFLELTDDQPLPPFDDDVAWADATVTADDLSEILTTPDLARHRKGVRLAGLRIVGDLDLDEARLDRLLMLRRCQLGEHRIVLTDAETRSIALGGSVCGGLVADRASITGTIFLDNGFSARGEVRLPGAQIGQLNCRGATLVNPNRTALSADGATISGDVFLVEGFRATGEVRLSGAQVGGQLACNAATLVNPNRTALSADQATISGGVFLVNGFNATGEVRLLGAQIGGPLNCGGATLANAGGMALSADRASITGTVFLDDGFSARGEVRLPGAQIGQLKCRGATLVNPGGTALNADGATISGGVHLLGGFSATGMVSLVNARAGVLVDSKADWPTELRIDGFHYDALDSDAPGWKDRGEWLRRQVAPSGGPYRQLAAVYRARGDDVDARKILMERHDALIRRDRPEGWWPHFPGRPTRAWRSFLRVTIGHGYAPWRALFWLLPILVGMATWYTRADDQGLLAPNGQAKGVASSRCTSAYPCVQPFVYAADTLIPVVDFGQRSKWTPDVAARGSSRYPWDDGRWLAFATWVVSGLGWIFATLIIAGFSNAIRKE